MPDLAPSASNETVTTWEFARGGCILACHHGETPAGTHTIVVTENGTVIERHEIRDDLASPAENARRLNDVREALRGIYQRRFVQGVNRRRK